MFRFSGVAFLRKSLQLDSKTDLKTNCLVLEIILEYASFRRRHICMD